jgi:hypothetical protein
MSDSTVNLGALYKQNKADNELECLEPGEYRLEVTSCKARATDIMPVYKVVAGPHTGKRVMAGVFSVKSEGAVNIFFQNMKGFGLGEDFFAVPGNESLEAVAAALKGRVADITLGVKQWKNEDRNEVKIGAIKIVSAPPLPAAGGVPTAAPPTAPPPVAAAPVAPAAPVAAPAPAPAPPVAAPPVAAPPAPPVAAAPAPPLAAVPAPAEPVAAAPPVAVAPAPPEQTQAAPVALVADADPNF